MNKKQSDAIDYRMGSVITYSVFAFLIFFVIQMSVNILFNVNNNDILAPGFIASLFLGWLFDVRIGFIENHRKDLKKKFPAFKVWSAAKVTEQ